MTMVKTSQASKTNIKYASFVCSHCNENVVSRIGEQESSEQSTICPKCGNVLQFVAYVEE
jgi:predicted RNA-binding Zn-ribbon protein involved in translation (DUF1610 family)